LGVSLVDMKVWNWLYKNPNATAEQLKDEVISAARKYGINTMHLFSE